MPEVTLEALSTRLRSLDKVGVQIATDARPAVEAAAKATAAAQTTPEGTAWAPAKRGGGPVLTGAAGAITAIVSGTTTAVITLVLRGFYVFHHYGVKGRLQRRQILPLDGSALPKAALEAIREATSKAVRKTVTP